MGVRQGGGARAERSEQCFGLDNRTKLVDNMLRSAMPCDVDNVLISAALVHALCHRNVCQIHLHFQPQDVFALSCTICPSPQDQMNSTPICTFAGTFPSFQLCQSGFA